MSTMLSFLAKRRSFLLGILGLPVATAQAMPSADKPLYDTAFDAFDRKSLEHKVQELADREEIRELINRYAHRVAHGAMVADLFTDDGAFRTHIPGQAVEEVKGRTDLEKYYQAVVNDGPGYTMPMIHNNLIEISGKDASGLCSIELRTSRNGKSMIGSGYYEDKYRKENGRWKFAVRDAYMFHWVSIQDGWAKKPG
jgi:ketosteroid isomerase-like protein